MKEPINVHDRVREEIQRVTTDIDGYAHRLMDVIKCTHASTPYPHDAPVPQVCTDGFFPDLIAPKTSPTARKFPFQRSVEMRMANGSENI